MILRNEQQLINPNNPWDGDQLDRQKDGEYFTEIIKDINQPFVISVCSEYGTGKTNFLKRWKAHIDKKLTMTETVYLDAWETDYSGDPLAAIVDCIIEAIPEGQREKITNNIDKIACLMARKIFSRYTGGISDDILDSIKDSNGEIKSSYIKEYQNLKTLIEETKKALKQEVKNTHKKIVFFIDELDRCRPNYAIEMLEYIKHFFDIPDIIFVIAVDDNQLVNAVSSIYGNKIDGKGYLRKFFNWQLNLPTPCPEKYANFLLDKFELRDKMEGPYASADHKLGDYASFQGFINYYKSFCLMLDLSLRDQEQAFITLSLIVSANKNNIVPLEIFGFLLAIYSYLDFNDFKKFLKEDLDRDEEIFTLGSNASLLSKTRNTKILDKYADKEHYKFLYKVLFWEKRQLRSEMVSYAQKVDRPGTPTISEQEQIQIRIIDVTHGVLTQHGVEKLSDYFYSIFVEAKEYLR